ncbi:hypothetical protein SUGI_0055180 [Cryptomeria japonica]|nr:hypothetical protein SUGI_0055180 [Cryptomeria japonica]
MHTRNTDLIAESKNVLIDREAPLENEDSVHKVGDYVHGVSLKETMEEHVRDETTVNALSYYKAASMNRSVEDLVYRIHASS